MMFHGVTRSVRRKLMLIVLATTFSALFLSACAVIIYDTYTYQRSWVNDLTTQAGIIARVSGPAIAFNDPATATENLALLKIRPKILVGAIYTSTGQRFSTYYSADAGSASIPDRPGEHGYDIENNQLVVYHPVIENGELVGTVYLRARYELLERVTNYFIVLAIAMLGSLGIAALIASRLQRTITKPVLAITEVAEEVMRSRDFSLRAEKQSEDEIGVLVDSFNGMLHEVNQRANDLEASNKTLAQEMITRRHAEAELLQADRRKDEFLAMLAHELRNPLAPISAAAQLLKLVQLDSQRVRQTSDIINRQVEHMTSLINDLLDVSRVTRGLIAIEKQPSNLNTIVAEAVEQVRPLLNLKRHNLVVRTVQQAVHVFGDEKRLVQVVTNVLNNAAKYTPEGGNIFVHLETDRDGAVIRIVDNGIGIAPELLPKVFELFTQAERSSDRSQGGLGLGLALVKSLVELHGGSVTAHSQDEAGGSEFVIRLPLLDAHIGKPDPEVSTDLSLAEPDKSLRIMIVDDNKDAAQSLAMFLEASGYEVFFEFGSLQALERVRLDVPDVCLLDIGLPEMDGYELARRLRCLPETANAVLIAVTGYGQQKDKDNSYAAGFDHHFVKPVDTAKLAAVLAQLDAIGVRA